MECKTTGIVEMEFYKEEIKYYVGNTFASQKSKLSVSKAENGCFDN